MAIAITSLKPEQEEEAVRLLARAFVTNPLHVAVLGADQLRANVSFFRIGLSVMKGIKLAAVDGSQLLGVVHFVESPGCRLSGADRLRIFPTLLHEMGMRSTLKLVDWLSCWAKRDPAERHVHLGPIGVTPEAQGRGIGRLLMEEYCAQLDRTGAAGYLETDRPENVEFYEKFGFEVTGTASIQGVENYFMKRLATNPI